MSRNWHPKRLWVYLPWTRVHHTLKRIAWVLKLSWKMRGMSLSELNLKKSRKSDRCYQNLLVSWVKFLTRSAWTFSEAEWSFIFVIIFSSSLGSVEFCLEFFVKILKGEKTHRNTEMAIFFSMRIDCTCSSRRSMNFEDHTFTTTGQKLPEDFNIILTIFSRNFRP